MQNTTDIATSKVAIITGAAHRIGACIAHTLHQNGMNVIIHYRSSHDAAQKLCSDLNKLRPDSAITLQAELNDHHCHNKLIQQAHSKWGRLDALINNASSFYPTPVGKTTQADWEELMGSNLKAPFFLSQAAAPYLKQHWGCIVNIVDIHADRPLKEHPVYSIAKAGLVMLTKAMACELGPEVRVNAIAPGAILWPEREMDEAIKEQIISRTFLKKQGQPADIARAILFLIRDADYTSGHVMTVDGGRSLNS